MGTNVRFLGKNLVNDECTFTLTSADSAIAANMYDRVRSTALYSSGSNDVTDEIYIIEFEYAQDFNRILVDNHNIKSGTIKYWNGSAYVDFSTPVAWAANAATTSFFEFTTVNSTKIKITMATTISANDEKSIGELIVCKEVGEVSANPNGIKGSFIDKKIVSTDANGGAELTLYGRERSKLKLSLKFNAASDADMAIFRTLKYSGEPFFVYCCAGASGYTQEPWRIQDVYLMIWANDFIPDLNGDLLGIGTKIDMELREA